MTKVSVNVRGRSSAPQEPVIKSVCFTGAHGQSQGVPPADQMAGGWVWCPMAGETRKRGEVDRGVFDPCSSAGPAYSSLHVNTGAQFGIMLHSGL